MSDKITFILKTGFNAMRYLILTLTFILTIMSNGQAQQPSHELKECPSSPNCVSSTTKSEKHHMEPISYSGSKDKAKETLMKVLSEENRVTITMDDQDYVRSEFKIAIFGFIDDVEFLLDDNEKKINFRSASRVGYSDLGVNKTRMIRIKRSFEKLHGQTLQ